MSTIKSKIKYFLLKITGKGRYLKKRVKCSNVWYGNAYGGFYLNPGLLHKNSIIYSFGIGEDVSFDSAVIENHNCHVFGFDPTPKSIDWIKKQILPGNFHFYEYGISNKSGVFDFYLPKNRDYVSGSLVDHKDVDKINKVRVCMKSINDIMKELGHTHIDVLKMDIEGSEYDIIEDIINTKISITQILIEFHERFYYDGKQLTKRSVHQLNQNGYEIFAVSDSFEEISFIDKNVL